MTEGPLETVLARLEGVRRSSSGYVARCPAHEDRSPSLSITEGDDGRALLHCHAGCTSGGPEPVVHAIGLQVKDLFRENVSTETMPSPPAPRRQLATYEYFDAAGTLAFRVVRYEPKDFRQQHPDGRGGWAWGRGSADPVLYRLPEVLEAAAAGRVVFIVEGEKDVEALEACGFVATCNPGGAGKWRPELHAPPLAGARVVVVPDNDGPGRAHARAVAQSVLELAADVRLVELPGMPEKGDVSDWLRRGGTAAELKALVQAAPAFDPADVSAETTSAETDAPAAPRRPIGTLVSDVEREAVQWLWPGRLALGKLTIIDGDPGLGKSTLYCDFAACVTAGRPWADGEPVEHRGGVVIVTTEDGIADTIRPRLEEAGADVEKVSVVQLIPEDDGPGRMPVLPDDVELLMDECERMGARLLIIDPLMAYLGDANSHKDQDVRRALAPLSEAAERAGVAVAVVRHLNKAAGASALYRGGGSIGIIGAARVGLFVGRDPEDEDRIVLACSKNNIAHRPPSLAFHLASSGRDPSVAVVKWEGVVPLSAEDLSRPAVKGGSARDEAADWLLEELADGKRRPAREMWSLTEERGLSEKTVRRALKRLGVVVEQDPPRPGGTWYWSLPSPQTANPPRLAVWEAGSLESDPDAPPKTPESGEFARRPPAASQTATQMATGEVGRLAAGRPEPPAGDIRYSGSPTNNGHHLVGNVQTPPPGDGVPGTLPPELEGMWSDDDDLGEGLDTEDPF